ncbi:MAG: B-box zinc finger protein [Planctomycetota bacterium]
MMITAKCRCTQRTIDTDKVGPWRLRCKTCHEIIYDPQAAAAAAAAKKQHVETTDDEKTQFNDFLQASNELKVLMSSEGEPDQRPCPKHPKYKIVAACSRCDKLLCKKCLDRIGDAFTCGDCVERQLLSSKEGGGGGGLMGFFRRLFGRGR